MSASRQGRRRMRATAALRACLAPAMVASVFLACDSPTAPLQREGPPAQFTFETGGFGALSRQLEVRGDTVVLRRSDPFRFPRVVDSVRIVPMADAWRDFWTAAERAGLRAWRPRYVAEGVVDGGGYRMTLVAGGTRIESTGSNAFPDRAGREHELTVPPSYTEFLAALNRLGGQPTWF